MYDCQVKNRRGHITSEMSYMLEPVLSLPVLMRLALPVSLSISPNRAKCSSSSDTSHQTLSPLISHWTFPVNHTADEEAERSSGCRQHLSVIPDLTPRVALKLRQEPVGLKWNLKHLNNVEWSCQSWPCVVLKFVWIFEMLAKQKW